MVTRYGEGGIRTPDKAFRPYNGLANRRLQPLGHLSNETRTSRVATGCATPCRSRCLPWRPDWWQNWWRSEEHTSELQSRFDLVCRLPLDIKHKVLEDDHTE